MSEKNVVMRNAVITLSIVCAISLISIPVIFVYHNSIFQLKDQEINRLSGVVNQKDSQIGDLQNQIKSQIAAAGTNNQVQVSGTIQPRDDEVTSVEFVSLNSTIKTSVPVVNGEYSILLVGGQSYNVQFTAKHYYTTTNTYYFYDAFSSSLYVPLGVTTFSANFS